MNQPIMDWPGVLEPSLLSDPVVAAGHHLADAAKEGDWPVVLKLLDTNHALSVNQWRPGGPQWFTPLHQAAWHGAPAEVVVKMLGHGALRSLPDAKGRTAHDVAVEKQQSAELVALLAPAPSPLTRERALALDANLEWVIDGRIHTDQILEGYSDHDLRRVLRYPPVAVLHEPANRSVWFPIPGMYGGFRITLRRGYLETTSWIRVVGDSGQTHVITHRGTTLVDEGFT
ncbi:MAG: ankyrin repeat domain-containing protein [Mycobacterium sp.]